MTRSCLGALLVLAAYFAGPARACQEPQADDGARRAPNVVVIFADDAGYGDFSCYGSLQIATPSIDSIAQSGVLCTQAYVTSSVCGPSRAGLLTGRYQQRFGAEFNVEAEYDETRGLPLEEVTIAEGLTAAGYRSIMLGKWHLGYGPDFHPLSHGFHDFYGFLKGSRSYRAIEGDELDRMLLDRTPVPESFEYLTTELGRRAAAYVDAHADRPFFLYLAPNAVHQPMHVRRDLAQRAQFDFPRVSEKRRALIAMTWALDEMVGDVLAALERNGLRENTLLFFLNDNGGAARNASSNGDLRGTKATTYEGGVRVPFLVQWPGRLPEGAVYDRPVSSLDVLATAWAAAGVEAEEAHPLDGVDLVPFLAGEAEGTPHETLYWRRGATWGVRHGDWKLLRPGANEPLELYEVAKDRSESVDLAEKEPARVKALEALHAAWDGTLVEPAWGPATGPAKGAQGPLGDPTRRGNEEADVPPTDADDEEG